MRDRPERNNAAHRAHAPGRAARRPGRVRAGSRRSCPAGRIDRLSERRAEFARSSIAAHDTYTTTKLLRTRARTRPGVRVRRRLSVAIADRPRRRADRPSLPPSPHPQPTARPLQYTIPEIEPLWVATMLCEYPGISSASRALAEEIPAYHTL
jgi:hypothetical protein